MVNFQMFGAQRLFGSESVFSPWMPRRGDNIIIAIDVVVVPTSKDMEVQLFHKNLDEEGDGTALLGTLSRDSVGRESREFNGVKELVRYRMTFTGTSSESCLYRMLGPVWWDDVNADGVA